MKKKKKKTGQIKVASAGLEGFMDWKDLTVSESGEEREAEMSSLATGFAARIHKRATNAQGEATLGSEDPDGKCFKQSGPTEEVQISPTVISVDSPKRALSALQALEGHALGVSQEACASLEDRAPTGEPSLDDEALHAEEVGCNTPSR